MKEDVTGNVAIVSIRISFQVKQVLLSATEAAEVILCMDNIIKAAPRGCVLVTIPVKHSYMLLCSGPFHSKVVQKTSTSFFLIVFQVQFSAFSPHPSPPPQLSLPPSLISIPLVVVHMSFIIGPVNPSRKEDCAIEVYLWFLYP